MGVASEEEERHIAAHYCPKLLSKLRKLERRDYTKEEVDQIRCEIMVEIIEEFRVLLR